MSFGDIVNKLHDENGLSYARTTEQSDFSTLKVRFKEVDDLYTCCEHFL